MSVPLSKSQPPWIPKPLPDEHYVVGDDWQMSYYDVTSSAPLGDFVKLPGGPASLSSGQVTGDFASDDNFQQT